MARPDVTHMLQVTPGGIATACLLTSVKAGDRVTHHWRWASCPDCLERRPVLTCSCSEPRAAGCGPHHGIGCAFYRRVA